MKSYRKIRADNSELNLSEDKEKEAEDYLFNVIKKDLSDWEKKFDMGGRETLEILEKVVTSISHAWVLGENE